MPAKAKSISAKRKGAGEKRVRKDVGDYIEFEEVPATETDKNDPDKQ